MIKIFIEKSFSAVSSYQNKVYNLPWDLDLASVNNLLLDNITNSASSPVTNHQNFKEKINPVFEKYYEATLNQLKKSIMKKLLSQYPPKSTYLENEKQSDNCIKKPHS